MICYVFSLFIFIDMPRKFIPGGWEVKNINFFVKRFSNCYLRLATLRFQIKQATREICNRTCKNLCVLKFSIYLVYSKNIIYARKIFENSQFLIPHGKHTTTKFAISSQSQYSTYRFEMKI